MQCFLIVKYLVLYFM